MSDIIFGMNDQASRQKIIIKTSFIGIAANLLLAAFKAAVGLISNSIAITLDSLNNFSDVLSSLITIIGTKLASRAPDRQHPLGHGRIEYISAVVIAGIILYAGITALIGSVKKIITPVTPEYSAAAIVIISAAILVKILLGKYVGKMGEKVRSDSLIASGKDALSDAILSLSTLAAAVFFILTHISIEAYLGVIISFVIIKTGYEILQETISEILGERIDAQTARNIRACINEFPEVHGVYDLVVHNYGPDTLVGSAHIEIPDTMNADEIDRLIRRITEKVYQDYGIAMTGLSIYSMNTKDEEAVQIRKEITDLALSEEYVLQLHGFYLNKSDHTIRFDLVIDFDAPDKNEICSRVKDRAASLHPEYEVFVIPDYDIADL